MQNLVVLDKDFRQLEVIDEYESLLWTDRYDQAGDFEVYTSASNENFKKYAIGRYLYYTESEHLMIIEQQETKTDAEDGARLIITGRSIECLLERRIIWNKTVIDGNLQDGVQRILNEAIINPSDENRKVSNFKFVPSTDTRITDLTMQVEFEGETVYEAICNICQANDLGFKVILNDQNEFVSSLYIGEDRSYEQTNHPYVIFSPNFDNIINSDYIETINGFGNVTLVKGEQSSNMSITIGEASGIDRVEFFTDAGDISKTNETGGTITDEKYRELLTERGNEEIKKHQIQKIFDGEIEGTQMFKYRKDFFMGDIVQVVNEYNIEAKSRVVEFIHSFDTSGYSTYPTFKIISNVENEV